MMQGDTQQLDEQHMLAKQATSTITIGRRQQDNSCTPAMPLGTSMVQQPGPCRPVPDLAQHMKMLAHDASNHCSRGATVCPCCHLDPGAACIHTQRCYCQLC